MKKSLIFILSIICALILLDSYISPIDNSINNESNANNNAFYLDHNITINKNQTVSFNNENIEVFTNNISITDYGTLNITNSKICAINYSITLNVYGGKINIINSSINAFGHFNIINSTAKFIDTVTQKNGNMSYYFQKDNILFYRSDIGIYSDKVKNICYTSGILYGDSYPYSKPGDIPLKAHIFYNKSYTGKLNLTLSLHGDNNGTGEIELYEHNIFIKNISIPVQEGNYNYNTAIKLPVDINSQGLGNTTNLAFKVPEDSDSTIAGEDGNITFYNITLVALSNDTENYFGINNYNIVIYNSWVNAFDSSFNTNMKNYYIYQEILNPNKKSIFLINSTFNSYNSLYSGSKYIDSPFFNINSSVYYYETPNFEFTNGLKAIHLYYNIFPNNYNKSLNQVANKYNKKIKNNSILSYYKPSYLFEIQNNDSMKYYGDYQLSSGKYLYNFSIPPIPSFEEQYHLKIYLKIPDVEYSFYLPDHLISRETDRLWLNITSLLHGSKVNAVIIFSNITIYNRTLNLSKNQTISIPINIYSKNNGELRYNISYKNSLYNYSMNKGSKFLLRFTPKETIVQRYSLTINSSQPNWELIIGNKTISEKNKNIVLILQSGYYNITIKKPAYASKSITIDLNENSTLYVSLQKIPPPSSAKKSYTMFYLIAIFIAISMSIVFVYSKNTVTCYNCGTKYYRSYNQCPVCLKPKKTNTFKRNIGK